MYDRFYCIYLFYVDVFQIRPHLQAAVCREDQHVTSCSTSGDHHVCGRLRRHLAKNSLLFLRPALQCRRSSVHNRHPRDKITQQRYAMVGYRVVRCITAVGRHHSTEYSHSGDAQTDKHVQKRSQHANDSRSGHGVRRVEAANDCERFAGCVEGNATTYNHNLPSAGS